MAAARVMKLVLAVISLSALLVHAVDRGNFKTCDQSGFCKRQRSGTGKREHYDALLNTLQPENTKVSCHLINKETGNKLLLELYALQDNTVRLKVNELDPGKPRYEIPVGEALVEEPVADKLLIKEQDSGKITLALQNKNEIVLHGSPFRLDFIVDNEPVISVNSRELLKFEHFRSKPGIVSGVLSWLSKPFSATEEKIEEEKKDNENEENNAEEKEEEPKEEQKEEEEPGMWEETFKTHTDTKPNGPMSVGIDLSFPGFNHAYGIPEHADTLALKTTKTTDPYRLYNLDVFEYELNNPMALYGSVPVMFAHNERNTVGVFFHNAAEMWVDISSNTADKNMFSKMYDLVRRDVEIPQTDTHWFAESGILDVFFLLGPHASDAFRQHARLTGTTPLPPMFALAYHQSRWNYNDEQDVANVDAGFDEHNIPMDVIWLDIEHTDGKRYFTWDAHKFPHSADMIRNISAKGRKMVTIIDPHIKKDSGYKVYQQGQEQGYFIKNKDNNEYEGWCWPGSSAWLDFTDPTVRGYWANHFLPSEYEGSTLDLFTWNDMNEPSVFNGPEITMHKDAKHFGDWEHRDVHNLYGALVHRASVEGQLLRDPNQRPFVLSRAVFSGTQRYGAVWTGDNTGEWGHLKISLPMLLSLNLVGVTQSGADIGGFFKNPDSELLTRWYQAAAYQPFMRAHAHLDTRRREPWLLPEDNMKAIREAIGDRYRLLPYWYTLFANSESSGEPVMKPLWVEFPSDTNSFTVEDEHLIGPGLLVHPITDAGSTGVSVYLPGSNEVWYSKQKNYEKITGAKNVYVPADLFTIPVYYRGGHIIPSKERLRRSSALMTHDPYTLTVALNQQGEAIGDLYTDDWNSFDYKKGGFVHKQFIFRKNQLFSRDKRPGSYKTEEWLERVIVLGASKPSSIQISGPGIETTQLDFKYEKSVLTIRKPGVNIASDFTINLL